MANSATSLWFLGMALGLVLLVPSGCSSTAAPPPPSAPKDDASCGKNKKEEEEETSSEEEQEEEEEAELRLAGKKRKGLGLTAGKKIKPAELSLKAGPTYIKDIEPIMEKCVGCHGEKSKNGPLHDYAAVKKLASKVVERIKLDKDEEGFMPKDGKALEAAKTKLIEDWVKAKHPEGEKEEEEEEEEEGDDEEEGESEGARKATGRSTKCS